MQGVDIAVGAGAVVLDGMRRVGAAPERAVQAIDERIEVLGFEPVEPAEVGDQALAGGARLGAVGFDQLQLGASAGAGEARKHDSTLHHHDYLHKRTSTSCVPLQHCAFRKHNSLIRKGVTSRKQEKRAANCGTWVARIAFLPLQ